MLDPQGREEVLRTVHELSEETGLTVISITHDLEEALLADRIIVMNEGKSMQKAHQQEIFSLGQELVDLGLIFHLR